MIVETLERQQKQDLAELRELVKGNRSSAAEMVREWLLSAKLIDKDGKLAQPYASMR